jgi:DNA-binding CsgD family transcriptional regulator
VLDWQAAFDDLERRGQRRALAPGELEELATAAYLSGRDAHSLDALVRAHTVALERGATREAARAAFWIAFTYIGAREITRAAGWNARARRLLEQYGRTCVEYGYVLLPEALARIGAGDPEAGIALFAEAEQIAGTFGDADLACLARQGRGRALVGLGRIAEGTALLDEAMAGVTAGDVSPIVAGTVYCSVITACFDIVDVRRAREWTDALTQWCERQAHLVPFRGECLAHRADILRLHGRWPDAMADARRAFEALAVAGHARPGMAAYALAETHRLRGEFDAAEAEYRRASEHGRPPQPGLALLRLAQGRTVDARAAIARVLDEQARGRVRADILAAAVEILSAAGDASGAGRAAAELDALATSLGSPWLRASAEMACGAALLAEGRAAGALAPLRRALAAWHDLDAPYEAARTRVLLGRACRAHGDADGARLEWDAAARTFQDLGAAPALAALDALRSDATAPDAPADAAPGGLTARELEVLRHVARGDTNRAIAAALHISEKTVARHLSNIFTKLDVSTRSAAAAYAFTHGLVR